MKNSIVPPRKALYSHLLKGVILCCWIFVDLTFHPHTALAGDHPTAVNIGTHPSDKKVCIGGTATFSVAATGTGTLIYSWQKSPDNATWTTLTNNSTYSGTGTATLTVTGATAAFNGFFYRCVVTDNNGAGVAVPSNSALLKVGPVGQPANSSSSMCSNGGTNLTSGDFDPTYHYQWQVSTNLGGSWNNVVDGSVYSGAATAYLNVGGGDPTLDGNLYRTIVTDPASGCSVTSVGVDTLHVVNNPAVVTPTPPAAFICSGANATIAITDSTGVSYQWRLSTDGGSTWSNISDNSLYTGTSTYSLTIVAPTSTGSYSVVRSVTGYGQTCTTPSNQVNLTFKTPQSITSSPVNSTVCANSNASFRVFTSGSTPTYQWQQSTDNGATWTNITSGGASVSLSRTSVTTSMNGYQYRVIVSGCAAPITSGAATLKVNSSGTWLGSSDTAWENGLNWCGGIPTPTTDVLVPAVAPRMPLISAHTGTATAQSLTIQSKASLTISGGTVSITAPYNIAGTVIYKVNGNQNIFPADHGSLQIDSAGNKIMQSNVAITDTLTLGGNAMLVTGNNILSMKAGSQPIRGAAFSGSQTSWVVTGNGSGGAANTGLGGLKIAQIGLSSGAVLFPVGPTSATYNPLQLTNGGAVNDFTVAVNDQYIPGAPVNSVIDRTWLVSAVSAGTSNISFGLLWRLADEPITGFNRASAAIVRSNGTILVEQSTAGAASGSNPYSLSKGSFSTLTQFSVATSTMVTLAQQLLSFSGQWIDNTSTGLSWNVNPDAEISSYVLQRSASGAVYTDIATVNGEAGKASYSFYDNQAGKDNFYRIKLVSSSGSISYSHVIELSGGELANLAKLAPSVTDQSTTNLLLTLGKESNIAYFLTDIAGHIMVRNAVHLVKGQHSLSVDVSRMPAGMFFIHVTDGQGFSKVLTLIKK